jgi:predicted nucleic acid-binding protein
MTVVADTGPVHYLVLSGCIELAHDLYGTLLMPPAVQRELLHQRAPVVVRDWALRLPAWADVRAPRRPPRFQELGPGEREAIELALETQADFVLMDETLGRRLARQAGLNVKGTLGVLEDAADRDLIDLGTAIGRLRLTNMFVSEELFEAALARNASRKRSGPLGGDGPSKGP